MLVHHARKGSGQAAGDPDSLRGASSIVGAARIVLTVLTMDDEQAASWASALGIAPAISASTAPSPTTPHWQMPSGSSGSNTIWTTARGGRRRAVAAAERIRRP